MLLDAGTDLLLSDDRADYAGNLSLIDVCRHAGLGTAGSAYKIWPTQEHFRVDLLRHALQATNSAEETTDEIQADLSGPPMGLSELIRIAANQNATRNRERPTAKLYPALWYAAHGDPQLAEQIRASDRHFLTEMASVYDSVITSFGREWCPPFDAMKLAVLLASLVEGLTMRAEFAPELVDTALLRPTGPDGEPTAWHLFACGAEALVELCTRSSADAPVG